MKKVILIVGVVVGFILGSRSGRSPYEQLEKQFQTFVHRRDVQEVIEAAKETAQDKVDTARVTAQNEAEAIRKKTSETMEAGVHVVREQMP